MKGLDEFLEFYNKLHSGQGEIFLYHFHQEFKGIDLDRKRILDIGCGRGYTSLTLAALSKDIEVTAIDEYEGVGHDKANYDFFRGILKDYQIKNIDLQKIDFLKNGFQNDEFDIVVANHSLHHIISTNKHISNDENTKVAWVALFEEIKRLLKKKGVLVIKESTRNSVWRILPVRLKNIDWEIHPTKREFIQVIKRVFPGRLEVENVVNYRLRRLSPLLRKNPLFTFFITPEFYIKVQK